MTSLDKPGKQDSYRASKQLRHVILNAAWAAIVSL